SGGGGAAGFDTAGDCAKTIVACGDGAAAAFGEGGGFFGAGGGVRLPVWNIIVRPGASPAGASALAGAAGFAAAAGGADGFGGCAGFATTGAANMAVERTSGARDGAGAGGFGGSGAASGAAAAARSTLNVFWHFPQRMVRPC